jgi:hypothetical protein
MFSRKPATFDLSQAVIAAIDQAMKGGMNRRAVLDKLKAIVEAQERSMAMSYRSEMLPPDYSRPRQ